MQAVGAVLDAAPVPDSPHLHALDAPSSTDPGLAILRGSLAPAGAVVKVPAVPQDIRQFSGPARVFEPEQAAIDRLAPDHPDALRPGDVAVLRMMGPRGGPGTVFAASFMANARQVLTPHSLQLVLGSSF